jgi:hypothetical protein
MASLLVEVLYHCREQGKYRLREFVVTPNHFYLLLAPAETLERAPQLVKGGFPFAQSANWNWKEKSGRAVTTTAEFGSSRSIRR